jgi:DNA-binding NarL/FixJ family response regulator
MATTSRRVLLADDHELVRESLRRLIGGHEGWSVCAEAANGREAVTMAERERPDVAILDIGMPELNGLDATRQILQRSPSTEVLIFTGIETEDLVFSVFDAGARSYILKSDTRAQLLAALQAAAEHRPYFTTKVGELIFSRYVAMKRNLPEDSGEGGLLSPREREIVQLVAEGRTSKEVAARLGISVKTAETHRASVMRKLRLETLSDLIRYAIRNHLIEV